MSTGPLFITTDAIGGVWSYSLALARGLSRQGQNVVLAVLGPSPDTARRAEVATIAGCALLDTGLKLEWCLGGRAALDALIAELSTQARQLGASAIHLHAPALAANGWAIPVVSVVHSCMATWWNTMHGSPLPPEISWHAQATSDGMARSNVIVAPSKSFARLIARVYNTQQSVHVILNGLSELELCHRERCGHVLTAGRLWDCAKNVAVLNEAAALVPMPILAAGPCRGPEGAEVRFSNIVALGNLNAAELHAEMARAAVFASPALYEPFGLAVLEAAQRATPLVLADIPTFRELWDGAAVFVRPNDAAAWASCLIALSQHGGRRHRLGQAARERSRRYRQDTMVANTIMLHRHAAQHALRAA